MSAQKYISELQRLQENLTVKYLADKFLSNLEVKQSFIHLDKQQHFQYFLAAFEVGSDSTVKFRSERLQMSDEAPRDG